MTKRTILKERESKPLLEKLRILPGLAQMSAKSRVEVEAVKDDDIVFVDGRPIAVQRMDGLIPVLANIGTLARLPKVVVDMGAVPHVVGGADVMAPGVKRVEGEFSTNGLLVVIDEKYGKYLAVGRALMGSDTMAETKKGKVVENLHYVGDPVWETVKGFARQTALNG